MSPVFFMDGHMPILVHEELNKLQASMASGLVIKESEQLGGLQGQLFIRAYEGDTLVYEYTRPNVVVKSASILIARLLKDSKEPLGGIGFFAVGTGGAGWDLQDPPAPTINQTRLESELARKAIGPVNTSFVDPATGDYTTTPTNVVDFSASFANSEAVGPLTEMALFGGDATSSLNSGTMLNYRTFPVLNKTTAMHFSVIFRITC